MSGSFRRHLRAHSAQPVFISVLIEVFLVTLSCLLRGDWDDLNGGVLGFVKSCERLFHLVELGLEFDRGAGFYLGQLTDELVAGINTGQPFAIHSDDDIPWIHSGFGGCSLFIDFQNQREGADLLAIVRDEPAKLKAEVTTPDSQFVSIVDFAEKALCAEPNFRVRSRLIESYHLPNNNVPIDKSALEEGFDSFRSGLIILRTNLFAK